jgi:hypothetical protein
MRRRGADRLRAVSNLCLENVCRLNFTGMKSFIGVSATCLALAVCLWLIWAISRERRLADGFERIHTGESEEDVRKLLGPPKRIEPCGEFFGPIDEGQKRGCAKEFLYASPFSPLEPQYYVIRFDPNNAVSSANAFSSP